jgi:hypothetical protein
MKISILSYGSRGPVWRKKGLILNLKEFKLVLELLDNFSQMRIIGKH